MSLVPLAEAQAYVAERCQPLTSHTVALADARGLVLATDVRSEQSIPPWDNTAMDGFAVRAADTTGATEQAPVRLRVVDTVTAGAAPTVAVGAGEAVRIMTGAPMPPGADAVVIVERTQIAAAPAPDADAVDGSAGAAVTDPGGGSAGDATSGDPDEIVEVLAAADPGQHVRRTGDDLAPGDVAVAAGTPLGPAALGVLSSLGVTEVSVIRRARVGVLSTGDELVVGPAPLAPGQIRDSNRPALLAAVTDAGAEPVDLGCIPDDESAIGDALRAGIDTCDAVLSSGGVSMGDVDLVKVVLDEMSDMRWMQVAIRPAKPFAFGVARGPSGRTVPIFGLPGNPVSSLVSFELFARPALRAMMGHPVRDRPTVRATAEHGLPRRSDGKTHFVRVRCSVDDGRWRVVPARAQGSHQLSAMAGADGLAVVPDGDGIPAGGDVAVLLLVS